MTNTGWQKTECQLTLHARESVQVEMVRIILEQPWSLENKPYYTTSEVHLPTHSMQLF